eukprot:COSAG02_NODE_4589_length_5184_cov_87.214749_1_plen_316_part_10
MSSAADRNPDSCDGRTMHARARRRSREAARASAGVDGAPLGASGGASSHYHMLLLLLASLTAVGRHADASGATAGAPASVVSKLTGEGALHDTTGANVRGCDLGIQFEHQGELWALFGDTFGNGSDFVSPHGARTAWRSQTLARLSVRSTSGDLSVAAVAWDRASETDTSARELMHADHDTSFKSELTVIPTAAWSNNVTTHVWYMSIKHFDGDVWTCNNASVGTATGTMDDRGFVKHDASVFWPGNSDTLQFAVANIDMRPTRQPTKCVPDPKYIYLFGTPCGRLGAGRLLRVPKISPLRSDAYEYFIKNDRWST